MGGRSPIMPNTEKQANALEDHLRNFEKIKVFINMRYWHPMADAVAQKVKDFDPDQIVLLPLYPQFSDTTTASSVVDWKRAAKKFKLNKPTHLICCFPDEDGFVTAVAKRVMEGYQKACQNHPQHTPRILFSAHGLPVEVIKKRKDPYSFQINKSAEAVIFKLKSMGCDVPDWKVCYQSRVTPEEWLKPATDEEVRLAGKEGVPLVIVPIAFVSEHIETLVELDKEYGHLAQQTGVPGYYRVPTVDDDPDFIKGLAKLVTQAVEKSTNSYSVRCNRIKPICEDKFNCPCKANYRQ